MTNVGMNKMNNKTKLRGLINLSVFSFYFCAFTFVSVFVCVCVYACVIEFVHK